MAANGSSQRVRRLLILQEPASPDAGEITEKGYLNQKAVLARRVTDVQRIYTTSAADPLLIGEQARTLSPQSG